MKINKLCKGMVVIATIISLAGCTSNKKMTANDRHSALSLRPAISSAAADGFAVTEEDSMFPVGNDFGFLTDRNLTPEQALAFCTYYFKFNSTELLGANLQAVQAHGNYLVSHPQEKVLIKGYTDIQGSREYNIGLGYRRAQAVAKELMAQGAEKSQIEIVSYGPEFPADAANTQEAYQKNRRAELTYCKEGSCKSVYGPKALKGNVE